MDSPKIIRLPIRSLTEPPALKNSHLATIGDNSLMSCHQPSHQQQKEEMMVNEGYPT